MIKNLQQFYKAMHNTISVRKELVRLIVDGSAPAEELMEKLKQTLSDLKQIQCKDGRYTLELAGESRIDLELDYEINELEKDLFFLTHTEQEFFEFLSGLHPGFSIQVLNVINKLGKVNFRTMISDRDGTVNNYCGRYASSVQSVYNAVMLSAFSRSVPNAVILTSAPLSDIGLADISVLPENSYILAGSKGREYLDQDGKVKKYPVPKEKQEQLDILNQKLSELLCRDDFSKFMQIGSGLQYKFGQTTVARQDISGSIPEKESESFLALISNIVAELDPDGCYFRIEDTGKDIEVMLTVEDDDSGLRDFDKGDGVQFLNSDLQLRMDSGTTLICGDTGSDVPMINAAKSLSSEVYTVFVTEDEKLRERVLSKDRKALFVSEPDMLVASLYKLSQSC